MLFTCESYSNLHVVLKLGLLTYYGMFHALRNKIRCLNLIKKEFQGGCQKYTTDTCCHGLSSRIYGKGWNTPAWFIPGIRRDMLNSRAKAGYVFSFSFLFWMLVFSFIGFHMSKFQCCDFPFYLVSLCPYMHRLVAVATLNPSCSPGGFLFLASSLLLPSAWLIPYSWLFSWNLF